MVGTYRRRVSLVEEVICKLVVGEICGQGVEEEEICRRRVFLVEVVEVTCILVVEAEETYRHRDFLVEEETCKPVVVETCILVVVGEVTYRRKEDTYELEEVVVETCTYKRVVEVEEIYIRKVVVAEICEWEEVVVETYTCTLVEEEVNALEVVVMSSGKEEGMSICSQQWFEKASKEQPMLLQGQ